MSQTPRSIRIRDDDNVAIVVNSGGLPAGTKFPDGLVLRERVPQGHKVSLTDLAEGEPIIRYGQVIGYAAGVIPRGSWIAESRIHMPTPPALNELPIATKVPAPQEPLEG